MSAQTRQHKRKSSPALTAEVPTTMSTFKSIPQSSIFVTSTSRATDTHVFFWSGVLSNWHQGAKFRGSRIFALLLLDLEKLDHIKHPAMDSFATRLLSDHMFSCGEQWMMAMKAWFFEDGLELGNWVPKTAISASTEEGGNGNEEHDDEEVYQRLKSAMYDHKVPKTFLAGSKERLMWESAMCTILRASTPRQQKAIGRRVRGFNESVWTLVCMPCVIAACIARAEVEVTLRRMYLASGTRGFVEGSPVDAIWGVGIHWKESVIEDPALWAGENRLGICHDNAAKRIKEMFSDGKFRSDAAWVKDVTGT